MLYQALSMPRQPFSSGRQRIAITCMDQTRFVSLILPLPGGAMTTRSRELENWQWYTWGCYHPQLHSVPNTTQPFHEPMRETGVRRWPCPLK